MCLRMLERTFYLKKTMETLNIILIITIAYSFNSCKPKSSSSNQKPPNIIYIMADQLAFDAVSFSGNSYVKTPSIDKLANNGVAFTNAYCAFPLCVPSRTSMFSSRMAHEAGVFVNTHTINDQPFPFETLAPGLLNAGYYTHYIGKWHLTIPKKDIKTHGFQTLEIPGEHGYDTAYARLATQFLAKEHEHPFFLVVSFVNPHDCCQLARGEDLNNFEGSLPSMPPLEQLPPLPKNFEIPSSEPNQIRNWQQENKVKLYPSYDWTERQFREYLWGYYRLVEKVDSLIGDVIKQLEKSEFADNTIIIFTSDHGDGESKHRWNQKWSFYDESTKVPFVVSGNILKRKGETEGKLVSSGLDLLPTIYDYACITPPEGILGRSLKPIVENKQINPWRDYVVSEISHGNWVDKMYVDSFPKGRMVRSENFKYIAFDKGEIKEQLIDMINDPGEMTNLAFDSTYFETLYAHRAMLSAWCKKTNDSFVPIP